MSAPKAKIALTREQLDALQWWVISGQREDARIVREALCPAITAAAQARLEQLEALNAAIYGAHFPLTARERSDHRARTAAALPTLAPAEEAPCTR